MDESTPDKIRRNLVIASTLILLAAWLDVPVERIIEKMISAPTSIVSATQFPVIRIWAACFAVLVYLILRYRFSPEWYGYHRLISGPILGHQGEFIKKLIKRDFSKYQVAGTNSTILQDQLVGVGEKYQKIVCERLGVQTIPRPLPVLTSFQPEKNDIWHGLIHAEFHWSEPEHTHTGASMRYAVTGWEKYWIEIRSYGAVVFYSESSIQALMPIVLAIAAFIVVLRNIACSWSY